MKIIISGRPADTLATLVKMSAKSQTTIVADIQKHCKIIEEASRLQVKIPNPITYNYFLHHSTPNMGYAIDDIEKFLKEIGTVKVACLSLRDTTTFTAFLNND